MRYARRCFPLFVVLMPAYVKDSVLAIRTEDVRLVFRPEALNMEMSSPAMITATEWESGKR